VNLATDALTVMVGCPACFRPLHLRPGPVVEITDEGHPAYRTEVLEDALRLHLRLGCDAT
jgi:hypothetical protein